jgi:hypothetical protein
MKNDELKHWIEELGAEVIKMIKESFLTPEEMNNPRKYEVFLDDINAIIETADHGNDPIEQCLAPTQLALVKASLHNKAAAFFQPGGDFVATKNDEINICIEELARQMVDIITLSLLTPAAVINPHQYPSEADNILSVIDGIIHGIIITSDYTWRLSAHQGYEQRLTPTQLALVKASLHNKAAAFFQPGGDFPPTRYYPHTPDWRVWTFMGLKLFDSRWAHQEFALPGYFYGDFYLPGMHTSETAREAMVANNENVALQRAWRNNWAEFANKEGWHIAEWSDASLNMFR